MTYAENKRRVLAASIAAILVLAVGVLLGTALAGNSGIPPAKLTAAQAKAKTLTQELAKSEQTLTAAQAAARAHAESLGGRVTRLQGQIAQLTARIRAVRRCLAINRRDANRCVAKALR
jgi:chromosome segregation ATPase